jgi:hypothetical protein
MDSSATEATTAESATDMSATAVESASTAVTTSAVTTATVTTATVSRIHSDGEQQHQGDREEDPEALPHRGHGCLRSGDSTRVVVSAEVSASGLSRQVYQRDCTFPVAQIVPKPLRASRASARIARRVDAHSTS